VWGLVLTVLLMVLTACGDDVPEGTDPRQVDAVEAPDLGACRNLTVEEAAQPSNAGRTVECSAEHTAQTIAVGSLPTRLHDAAYDAPELETFAYRKCTKAFVKLLGADESQAMRSILTWAWFRPSVKAWASGARWYRCDILGGGLESAQLLALPTNLKGILGNPDDAWLACATGPEVDGSVKVPCSTVHDWRAVSTIKLGEPDDPYPGDRIAEVTTRDYCSQSVGAWLGYPDDYDFGYTWFHETEWAAGNRRSVCWAKTSR